MRFRKYAALALCIGAAGCSSNDTKQLEASEVANTSATLAGALVRDAGSATSILASLTALQSGLSTTGAAGADGASGGTAPVPPPPAPAPAGALGAVSRVASQPALTSARSWLSTAVVDPSTGTDQAAADLETLLRTRIFTEANLESADETSATFLLHGSTLCTDGTVAADPACVSTVDELQLRIKATKAGGGFDFAFIIGPARANPATLGLRPGSLSVSIDLGGVKAASAHVADVTGSPIPLPAVMEGAFRLAINKLGDQHVSLVASVLSAIHVRDEAVDGPYDYTTQPADPLLSFEADAVAGVVTVRVGFGATTVLMPYLVNVAAASPRGFTTFGVDLGGLSWTLRTTVATPDVVELTGLGLGTTPTRIWASKADEVQVEAVTVDLTGAPIDVTLQDDPLTGTTVSATPFDLAVGVGLAQLDWDVPDDGSMDGTYAVSLAAGAAGADPVLFIPASCDPLVATCPMVEGAAMKVVTGSLALSKTDPSDVVTEVTVPEGACLLDDGTGILSSGSCTPPPLAPPAPAP